MNSALTIVNSTERDIEEIFNIYEEGTTYQKKVATKHWKGFQRSLIQTEISEHRQWKILVNGKTACVFVITFSDPCIWQERSNDPSIYIHRIATHPAYRGNGFVKHIVSWAKSFAIENKKSFIRMDTGSGNDKLNRYYIDCGFTYLGVQEYLITDGLPEHYKDGSSSLFEIKII